MTDEFLIAAITVIASTCVTLAGYVVYSLDRKNRNLLRRLEERVRERSRSLGHAVWRKIGTKLKDRRARKRFSVILIAGASTLIASSAIYLMCLAGDCGDPKGMYSSYEFFPHAKTDVLEFRAGVVTQRTCCGDVAYGTYFREDDGTWTWRYQLPCYEREDGTPVVHTPVDFSLHPKRFSLTIVRRDDPNTMLTMRRRIFARVRL